MTFDEFARRARELAEAMPPEFLEGIDTVDVHPETVPHPNVPDVFTLGECETSHISDPTGQEPFHSIVHLYHGSFVALAEQDPTFDVEAELEETLTHEIQHHLEDRAGLDTLRDEDGLFEAHARFRAGLELPRGWYRMGDPVAPGLWAVDLDLFLELPLRRAEWDRLPGTHVTLAILDDTLEVDVPADVGPDEIWTFEGEGLLEGDEEDDDDPAGSPPESADEPKTGLYGDLHVVPVVR